ncbi:Uncharacterised protein [Escherichia coli]|uniref:Uncharacterized protein n=1 Tax=Escherichia coli TaxID=562 RepID=A0A2X1LDI2_ECOLX|nr:Uncharacterised protein [Escherichia coli]
MFGGGDVDLRRILSAVSDEIEGEFGEGKGLNFAMFENFYRSTIIAVRKTKTNR